MERRLHANIGMKTMLPIAFADVALCLIYTTSCWTAYANLVVGVQEDPTIFICDEW